MAGVTARVRVDFSRRGEVDGSVAECQLRADGVVLLRCIGHVSLRMIGIVVLKSLRPALPAFGHKKRAARKGRPRSIGVCAQVSAHVPLGEGRSLSIHRAGSRRAKARHEAREPRGGPAVGVCVNACHSDLPPNTSRVWERLIVPNHRFGKVRPEGRTSITSPVRQKA